MPPLTPLCLALILILTVDLCSAELPSFREAPAFRNGRQCPKTTWTPLDTKIHNPCIIHIAMTLETAYLRGSIAGVFSVLRHATCPENIVFHFITTHRRGAELSHAITSTFPYLNFQLDHFDINLVKGKISSSVRRALDQPLNYARMFLADILPAGVRRIIYFDSDLIVVDDVIKLWSINLRSHVLGAPEYCHANFTNYFTSKFWSNPAFTASFKGRSRNPCYFNTGVMVIDLWKWREGRYTEKLENWMRIQKRYHIYELGSLPPFLLFSPVTWKEWSIGGTNMGWAGITWKVYAGLCIPVRLVCCIGAVRESLGLELTLKNRTRWILCGPLTICFVIHLLFSPIVD